VFILQSKDPFFINSFNVKPKPIIMTKAITNLVTIFLLAIIGNGLSAQDFSIEGELYKPNGDRIAGAEVLMIAGDQMATEITNDQGFYQHTFSGLADSTMIQISTEDVCSGEMLEEVIFYFPNGNVSVDFLMCNNNPSDSCMAMFAWNQMDGNNIQFEDISLGNPTVWEWHFGDGASSTEQSPLHQYQQAGEYMVTLEIEGEDCSSATEMYIFVGDSIWPPVGCEAYYAYETLSETNVQFYDLSEGDGIEYYSWDFGDGATSDEQNPQHEYAASGIYPVFLTISGDSCQSVYGMDIIVGDSIWPPNDSCMAMFAYYQDEESMQVYFEDLSMGNPTEWAWDFGDGNTSSEQNPVHVYQEEGIYVVHLIAGNDDCSSEIYMDIFVGDYWWPQDCQAMFYPYIDSTNYLTVHFINESFGGDAYLWEFGDGDTSTEANPVHTYAQEGEYIITLTISSDSCESSFSMAMMLNSDWMQGDYQALFYPELLHANTFIFHDMSIPADQISGWSWDFGDGNTSTEQNPEHSYAAAGNYVVNLEASVTGERNSSLYAIELNSETGEFTAMMNMSTTSVAEKQGPLNTAIYPNPVKGLLSYSFSSNEDATAEVRILNIAGQLIQAEQINVASGSNQGRIDVNSLNNGVYLLEIRYDEGSSETIRFIK
jgi:PKD repeat protein